MEFFLDFDVNFYSAFLLVVLYITMKLRKEVVGYSSKLFFTLLWMVVLLLNLEVLSWVFDRVPGKYNLNYFFNFLFALLNSTVTCILASYIDYHIYGSIERIRKRKYYLQPFVLVGLLLIINFFKPIIFSISADNVYSREPLMILIPIINVLMFVYICYLAYKERNNIQKEIVSVLLLYTVMPVVVAFVQVMLFGVYIIWPMMASIVILTYIFLETTSTSKDYLTGLLSRNRIDQYLDYLLLSNKNFIVVMIDLDDFKFINDTYGHIMGDNVLKLFSETLSSSFKNERYIGRYGGDEFILILEKKSQGQMIKILNGVKRVLNDKYENKELPFNIKFSYGYYIRRQNVKIGYDDVIRNADEMMYQNKGLE